MRLCLDRTAEPYHRTPIISNNITAGRVSSVAVPRSRQDDGLLDARSMKRSQYINIIHTCNRLVQTEKKKNNTKYPWAGRCSVFLRKRLTIIRLFLMACGRWNTFSPIAPVGGSEQKKLAMPPSSTAVFMAASVMLNISGFRVGSPSSIRGGDNFRRLT